MIRCCLNDGQPHTVYFPNRTLDTSRDPLPLFFLMHSVSFQASFVNDITITIYQCIYQFADWNNYLYDGMRGVAND